LDINKDGELGMKYTFSKLALAVGIALCGTGFASASIAQSAEFNLDDSPAVGEMNSIAFAPSQEPMAAAPVLPGGITTIAAEDDVAVGGAGGPHEGGHSVLSTLTDDQLEKMHNLHNQFLDDAGPKFIELASKERKLKDVMLANTVDAGQAHTLQAEINRLKNDLANLKLDNHIALANVLTADQKGQIRDHIYRAGAARLAHHHCGGMKHHHGGWGGPGGHE
jgi:Spy/CpxP family protein refolding chaperone